jgi:hypothetical protein
MGDQLARTKPRDSNWRAQLSTIAAKDEVSPPRLSLAEHIKVAWVLGLNILIDSGAGGELLQPKKPAIAKGPIARSDSHRREIRVSSLWYRDVDKYSRAADATLQSQVTGFAVVNLFRSTPS